MVRFFLLILALLVILSLAGYLVYLLRQLNAQKKKLHSAKNARFLGIIDSVEIIAKAMLADQCNLSEGVLRLKALLEVLGINLSHYPAMWTLYQVVAEMPILDERKGLPRNQRMKFDLTREAAEAEHQKAIYAELNTLLADIARFKESYV